MCVQTTDGEINFRLQMLSRLTVDCNQLDNMDADRIQQIITELRIALIELRTTLADRAHLLRQQVQPKGQNNDSQPSCSDLQKWFDDTRNVAARQADMPTDDSLDSLVCHQFVTSIIIKTQV